VHAARCPKIKDYAEKILNLTKSKITETRRMHPDRPLFLIGWGTGSIVATTASVSHPVEGVIALSFPLFGLAGPRGTLEDPILDMKKPVLFVIGGRSPDVRWVNYLFISNNPFLNS
jgi:regulatory NSL complex subunit 3